MDARYGINLSFRNYYDEHIADEELPFDFSKNLMDDISEALARFDGVWPLLKSEQQAAYAAPFINDRLLMENGFTRSDTLPAYLSEQLYDETKPMSDEDIAYEVSDVKMHIYDAIYHVQDALPSDFRQSLGNAYITYAARRAHDEIGQAMVDNGRMDALTFEEKRMLDRIPAVVNTMPEAAPENNGADYEDETGRGM